LNNRNTGYQYKREKEKLSHLFYINDLKLVAKNDKELAEQIAIFKEFSNVIRMVFEIDKCAKASFVNGFLKAKQYIEISDSSAIETLN